jgi:hypothetical protein
MSSCLSFFLDFEECSYESMNFYGFPMVSLWFSGVFQWMPKSSNGFPMVCIWIPMVFPCCVPRYSWEFLVVHQTSFFNRMLRSPLLD